MTSPLPPRSPAPLLLLAPAASGKTHHCLARIRALHAANPLAPIWVILPNQTQVAAFRRRLAEVGGAIGVQPGTFYTVYAEILARAGQPVPRLLDPVQHRLLRAIVDQWCDAGRLRHYAPLRDRPGFIVVLKLLVQELKRARVHRDDFAAAVAGLGPRLEELAAIFATYQDWLTRSGWADAEGQGWLAALALERDPDLCRDVRLLIVDGFDEFNPTQLAVLKLLARQVGETVVTLTGQISEISDAFTVGTAVQLPSQRNQGGQPPRPAHRRFLRAREDLVQTLGVEPQPLDQKPVFSEKTGFSEALTHLESALFEPSAPQVLGDGAVEFVEAQNRAEEVRAALRWIKARLVRDGMVPHEVAVLARDLGPYRPFLEETAAEFGLPMWLAGGSPLLKNPAIAALLSLLSLPVLDWPRRLVLDAWRSPYFDWSAQGIGPEDAARLDAAARTGLVIRGLDQWHAAVSSFEFRVSGSESEDMVAEMNEPEIPNSQLETRNSKPETRDRFTAFVARLSPPAQGTLRDYVAFVEDLVGDDPRLATRFQTEEQAAGEGSLRVVARAWENPATAARDIAALQAFKDVLRGLVLAESFLQSAGQFHAESTDPAGPAVQLLAQQGSLLDYRRFYDELRGAVEATHYETAPPDGGAVLAAPVLRARGLPFRAVALLGLSEGDFPQAEKEDTLLRERDRARLRARGLPLESRLRGDEVTLFYEAVTRARERLLLCRPYLADDGQAWEASAYWEQVRRLVAAPITRIRPEDPVPLDQAASPADFGFWILDFGLRAGIPEATIHNLKSKIQNLKSKIQNQDGDLSRLGPALATRYRPPHTWSASRLEAYGVCPFYFYIGHCLYLEPRRPPTEGYDVRMLGSMYHHILEEVHRRAQDPTDADELQTLLADVARDVFDSAPTRYGFRPTALWAYQRQELERILADTLARLCENTTGYTPRFFEQPFGFDNHPPLVIEGEDGAIWLHGYIDRVDESPDGRLRIVDYKAGGASITPNDLAKGQRLQLSLYALAVRDALKLGQVAGGFYWHIGRAEPSRLKLEAFEGGVDGALEAAAHHALAHAAAVCAGRFQPVPPLDGCPNYCPAVTFCWRYTAKRW